MTGQSDNKCGARKGQLVRRRDGREREREKGSVRNSLLSHSFSLRVLHTCSDREMRRDGLDSSIVYRLMDQGRLSEISAEKNI